MYSKKSSMKSKVLTSVLSMSMIASMGMGAFALDSNIQYLSPVPSSTEYTNIETAGTVSKTLEVYFSASADYANWYNVGFDNADQAEDVVWTVTSDDDDIISGSGLGTVTAGNSTEDSLITATGTVNLNTNKDGVAVVNANYDGKTLDLVVAVDKGQVQTAVSADVYVIDDSGSVYAERTEVDVYAPSSNQSSMLRGKSGAFQNQPTAMGTLDALKADETLSTVNLSDTGEYANVIDDMSYGWGYAVYDATGAKVPESVNTSASILVLPGNGYTVVWKYDPTYNHSFAATLTAEQGNWN